MVRTPGSPPPAATIRLHEARALAVLRAGLAGDSGARPDVGPDSLSAEHRALAHLRALGYLQLDSVSAVGARSHELVLASRVPALTRGVAEQLLRPNGPVFEYWAHEASWIPVEYYPLWAFRRRAFRVHPWWGSVVGSHPEAAARLLGRIRDEGPLRASALDPGRRGGWTGDSVDKRVAVALWSSGELAVAQRPGFQRVYDLAERAIPSEYFGREVPLGSSLRELALLALAGHGWAEERTIVDTFRLSRQRAEVRSALCGLAEEGAVVRCRVVGAGLSVMGWIRPADLEPKQLLHADPGNATLLSPFDPLLWDRRRLRTLFGFEHVLEIYKPVRSRTHGYYVMPLLQGDRLIARTDLKWHTDREEVEVKSLMFESTGASRPVNGAEEEGWRSALARHEAFVRSSRQTGGSSVKRSNGAPAASRTRA